MTWLGEYPEDHATVVCMFTTHDGNGAPVAPLTAFEAADVIIYKNGSATQKTSTNGVTMTSPFGSIVGLHCVVVDTSNDTGDASFWTMGGGGVYTLVLSPDTETVNGQTALKVIGQFGLALAPALTKPMTESYAADGSAPTMAQSLFLIQQMLTEMSISGTTMTIKKIDGTTSAATLTLNSATSPTSITRAT